MNSEKKKRLERSGWTVGQAADFLQLSPEEAKFIDLKLALASALRELREKGGFSQTALATRLGSGNRGSPGWRLETTRFPLIFSSGLY